MMRKCLCNRLLKLVLPAHGGDAVIPAPSHRGRPEGRAGLHRLVAGVAGTTGAQVALAVVFDIQPHFHIYPTVLHDKTNFTPTLTAVSIGQLPPGIHIGEMQFPPPVRVPVKYTNPPSTIEAYQGRVVFYLPVVIDEKAPLGHVEFKLSVTYGACNETSCLMPVFNMEVPVSLDIVEKAGHVAGGPTRTLFRGLT